MKTKNLYFAALAAIFLTSSANAVIGPIKISLNTEYRTSSPVIGSIATTIKLDKAAIEMVINRIIDNASVAIASFIPKMS